MHELAISIEQEKICTVKKEEYCEILLKRILNCTARIGVIGLGYVGLPLAVGWARAGFSVTGIDINAQRIAMCQQGTSWIADIASEELRALVGTGKLTSTVDLTSSAELDVVAICVPTPLNEAKEPDLQALLAVMNVIKACLHPGQLIILESTTYPGTTDEYVLPCLQQQGLKVGEDFFLAFSPERIDPGNSYYTLSNTPKVVAGTTANCLQVTRALYETMVDKVVSVSSTRVAELVKLFENTFRAVNIGLVNELAIMANLLGVDVWEVIAAASTKPYGFTPFYPGPGIGGHCIPIDPIYLAWKLRTLNYRSHFIEVASKINEQMPYYVVERINRALNEVGKCLKNAHILIIGVAYKCDIEDVREAPALTIIKLLREYKATVNYTDPYVPVLDLKEAVLISVPLDDERVCNVDCAVIVTNHHIFDYVHIVKKFPIIIDTRNATAGMTAAHVHRL